MKVSVIVPIYNAEPFLEKCIDSVLKQTYLDFELILVDDGSGDRSGSICDAFAQKDDRIRVIHKKNEGLISARITGLQMAKCEYIAFVDADDWVEDSFLERLVNPMENVGPDIVISGCIIEVEGRSDKITNLIPSGIYDEKQLKTAIIPKMLCSKAFYQFGILPYMWNKLFRRDILEACYVDIDTKIYDGEDVAVVYPYLLLVKRAVVIEDCMYHYRIHENSMTAKKKDSFYENVSRLYLHLNRQFEASEYYALMLPQLKQYLKWMVWHGLSEEERERERRKRQYCFPFGKVAGGSEIILYGAGDVGIKYYQQLKKVDYCSLISWVDRKYCELAAQGLPVESPSVIPAKNYDYIVIAIADARIREEIKMYLLDIGVKDVQIIMGEEEKGEFDWGNF